MQPAATNQDAKQFLLPLASADERAESRKQKSLSPDALWCMFYGVGALEYVGDVGAVVHMVQCRWCGVRCRRRGVLGVLAVVYVRGVGVLGGAV